ncbi:hypothetical protein [Calothrix sp. CCY 0018]|uniref:hypothetical protein n=1 Tax=Calothrix sp. CCY 0018 TaxID=3103864 RepID=UPI0039C61D3A
MHKLTQYEIDITLQEIEESDGYLEYHECGYPIYYAYNIIPDNGETEEEWFEPVDIVAKSISLGESLETCPCCGKKLKNGEYYDIDDIKEDLLKLIQTYCSNGDSPDFKILLEQIGIRLGLSIHRL